MPLCTSTPRGLLDCSGGMGHTWGALSLQDTWQENAQTEKEDTLLPGERHCPWLSAHTLPTELSR